MPTPCQSLIDSQPNRGKFISHVDAKPLLEQYLACEGEPQLNRADDNHIYGFLFGLEIVEEFIDKIKHHNEIAVKPEDQIDAIRIYKAKSKRTDGQRVLSDLLMVPVRTDGRDYPEHLAQELDEAMILCDSGPCPNICEPLYFHSQKFKE